MPPVDFQAAFDDNAVPGIAPTVQTASTYVKLFRTNAELQYGGHARYMFVGDPLYILIVHHGYVLGVYDVLHGRFETTDVLARFKVVKVIGDSTFSDTAVAVMAPSSLPVVVVSKDFQTVSMRTERLLRSRCVVLHSGSIDHPDLVHALFRRLADEEAVDGTAVTHLRNQRTWVAALQWHAYHGARVGLLEEFFRVGKGLYPTAFSDLYEHGSVLLTAIQYGMDADVLAFHLRHAADCYERTEFLTAAPDTQDPLAVQATRMIHKAVFGWRNSRRCAWVTACKQLERFEGGGDGDDGDAGGGGKQKKRRARD